MMLPAFAAKRQHLQHGANRAPTAIDRYLLPIGHSAANPPTIIAAVDQWDRRMDA